MKNIDVCLRLSSHPVFNYLVKFPPEGVEYDVDQKFLNLKSSFGWKKEVKKKIWKTMTKFRPPYVNVDIGVNQLIHSCHGMLISNKDPWIVDVEHAPSFANYQAASLLKDGYRNKIIKLLSSASCKKIIPWTDAAKKSLENAFRDERVNKKMEVVYPAVDIKNIGAKRDGVSVKFLVASRFFYEKGGKQALEVFEKLDKKYDVELSVLSIVPEEIKKKYSKIKTINFIEKIFVTSDRPNAIFEDYYSKYDILFNLTFADTFGLASIEAMSCGMPVLGTNLFSMPEIVEDGKTGFLVNSPVSCLNEDFSLKYHKDFGNLEVFFSEIKATHPEFINDVASKASLLIEDSKLRHSMSRNAKKSVESGKFSIKTRNRQLRRIYEEIVSSNK